MESRYYRFNSAFETAALPDPGTPTNSYDLITLSYLQSFLGTDIVESFSGPQTSVTLTHTPLAGRLVKVYVDGVRILSGWSLSGTTLTITIDSTQTLDVEYTY